MLDPQTHLILVLNTIFMPLWPWIGFGTARFLYGDWGENKNLERRFYFTLCLIFGWISLLIVLLIGITLFFFIGEDVIDYFQASKKEWVNKR